MTDTRAEILATLRKHEVVLQGLLQSVRYAIIRLQNEPPKQSPQQNDGVSLLLDQVLAELGEQFTSVDIFETTRKLKPGFRRSALNEVVERLVNHGLILKVEDGRGRRPARYRKQVFN